MADGDSQTLLTSEANLAQVDPIYGALRTARREHTGTTWLRKRDDKVYGAATPMHQPTAAKTPTAAEAAGPRPVCVESRAAELTRMRNLHFNANTRDRVFPMFDVAPRPMQTNPARLQDMTSSQRERVLASRPGRGC